MSVMNLHRVDERLLRARAEAEAEELRLELEPLREERLRLARRNERLVTVLLELRSELASSEEVTARIDEALDYDGREVPLSAHEREEEPDGSA